MTIHFNAAGAERKKLAMRIAEYEGCETQYLGAPTFAYAAGRCKVLKDGTVETENEDSALLTFLEGLGGVPEPTETPADSDDAETEDAVRISICLPAHDMTERQIQNVFDLSNKYLGSDSSPFVLGLFMGVLGEGSIAQGIKDQLTPAHARAVIQYMIDHPQIYTHTPHSTVSGGSDNTGRK